MDELYCCTYDSDEGPEIYCDGCPVLKLVERFAALRCRRHERLRKERRG